MSFEEELDVILQYLHLFGVQDYAERTLLIDVYEYFLELANLIDELKILT